MSVDVGVLIAVGGFTLAIAGYFGGRYSSNKSEGERWGKLETMLKRMEEDIRDIRTAIARVDTDTRDSIRRVHNRLDVHLREDHGLKRRTDTDNE